MENSDIEKDMTVDYDKGSFISFAVDGSTLVLSPTPQEKEAGSTGGTDHQLDDDEKEQSHHPERKGVTTWTIPSTDPEATHLKDVTVYGGDQGAGDEASERRLSFYEVTQQRDQTLYEKSCCSSDVIRVWTTISHYIKSKLRQGLGVTLPGLCTFTTCIRKCWAGQVHFNLKRRPILVLSPALVSRYNLVDPSEKIFGFRSPSSLINLTEVGTKAKVSRSIVEGIVTEVLQTFARALACGKPIEFPFPLIGKLQIRDQVAVMRFYAEFYRSMELDLDEESPSSNLQSSGIPSSLEKEATRREETLPGHMTPLNRNIPTESFRSVFHLREVRSVNEFVTVTEEDVHHVNCLELDCLPQEETVEIEATPEASTVNETFQPEIPPEFIWCRDVVTENGEEDPPRPPTTIPSDDENAVDFVQEWVQETRKTTLVGIFPEECQGEDGSEVPLSTPAPSLVSSEPEEINSRLAMTPPQITRSLEVDMDFEPGRPCHHTFRPEPLYNPRPSGNFAIDMILPEKTHLSTALFNHHYFLCSKILGVETVKKHFDTKVKTLKFSSSFHTF